MPKKTLTKKSGSTTKKDKRYSKEELLDIMNAHLEQQQKFAEELQKKAEKYLNEDTADRETKKLRNQYLYAYNKQVDAVSRTSSTMIRINNSSLETEDEIKQEVKEEELVD